MNIIRNSFRNSVSALVVASVGLVGPALAHDDGPKGHAQHRDGTHGAVVAVWRNTSTGDSRVIARQERQQQRIDNGWRSGELTRDELQRLDAQQARIAEMAHWFSADGRLTPAERLRLAQAQDRASAAIARTKHNDSSRDRSGKLWAVVYRDF